MKYLCTPIRMARIPNMTTLNADKDVESNRNFHHCWWECKITQSLQKMSVSYKTKHTLTIQLSNQAPGDLLK